MNSFWKMVLGSIARTAIASASGYAVAKGTVSQADATAINDVTSAVVAGNGEAIGGLIGLGVATIWGVLQKKGVVAK